MRDPQICSDLHDIFFGVHSNIVKWDNPVAVNPQERFANLSHPNITSGKKLDSNKTLAGYYIIPLQWDNMWGGGTLNKWIIKDKFYFCVVQKVL